MEALRVVGLGIRKPVGIFLFMEGARGEEEYAHVVAALLRSLPESLGKNTEIEIRLGMLIDKSTNKRLGIGFMHPCVVERADTLRFQACVEEKDFAQMTRHYTETQGAGMEKTIVDTLMREGRRSEVKEVNGKPAAERAVLIKKTKMKSVDIFCPQNKYDLRIGISEEIVKEDAVSFPTVFGVREKRRQTFNCADHLVELTEVRAGRSSAEAKEVLYEVEIEAVNQRYNQAAFIQTVTSLISSLGEMLGHQRDESAKRRGTERGPGAEKRLAKERE